MRDDEFVAAVAAVSSARGGRLDAQFVEAFPVDGAAVSTLGDLLGSETLYASDDVAARVDELQIDLGEGPCWEALGSARPVAEQRMRSGANERWPAFMKAMATEPVGSIYAFPMFVGDLRVGAIDLYSRDAEALDDRSVEQGGKLAAIVARDVIRRALSRVGRDVEGDDNPLSRRALHQATGMVLAQLGLSAADARLVIEGHAFASGQTVMEVARRIVDRDLVLTPLEVAE